MVAALIICGFAILDAWTPSSNGIDSYQRDLMVVSANDDDDAAAMRKQVKRMGGPETLNLRVDSAEMRQRCSGKRNHPVDGGTNNSLNKLNDMVTWKRPAMRGGLDCLTSSAHSGGGTVTLDEQWCDCGAIRCQFVGRTLAIPTVTIGNGGSSRAKIKVAAGGAQPHRIRCVHQ